MRRASNPGSKSYYTPAAKYFGALALMIPLIVYMYYVLIEAWCLSYAIDYLTGDLLSGSGGKFDKFLASPSRGGDIANATIEARATASGR